MAFIHSCLKLTKKPLVLGAGRVASPLVEYLVSKGYSVTVADADLSKAESMATTLGKSVTPRHLEVNENDLTSLDKLIKESDAVVSLLPATHHHIPAKLAIKNNKNFLSTSYVSDSMKELHKEAVDRNIILLNECGLDPGIDHMSSMKVIDHIRSNGGKVIQFSSFCGGLPAPEANDNPLGYKFSWAPRGVLMAARNGARWLENGKTVEIPGTKLWQTLWSVNVSPFARPFSGVPNRDSTSYLETYGLKDCANMVRGTLRYEEWPPIMLALVTLNWLDHESKPGHGETYGSVTAKLCGGSSASDAKKLVCEKLKLSPNDKVIKALEWLDLFSNQPIPKSAPSYLDALCEVMLEKMKYNDNERDLVVMRHTFTAQYSNRKEHMSSTLVDFGIPNGATSMSRTVGTPVAIATRMVLEGEVKQLKGVVIPTISDLYIPILGELEKYGIRFEEKIEESEK